MFENLGRFAAKRSRLAGLGAVIFSGLVLATSVPASAAGAAVLVAEGRASLNNGFPCNGGAVVTPTLPPPASSPYNGLCKGTADLNTTYGVTVDTDDATTPANNSCLPALTTCDTASNYDYTEPCGIANTGPTPDLGGAWGTLAVTDNHGTDHIDGNFQWERVGLTAIITIGQNSDPGGSAAGEGVSLSAFLPDAQVANPPTPNCANPQTTPYGATVVTAAVGVSTAS